MPFGLKNAGATYQRLVDRAFQKQIGRNLEVYADDLVLKSHTEEEINRDIAETFKTLRQINMKLNLKKCTFGMQEGMFLGYKVNAEGLKVCLDKADAVLSLPSPGCPKFGLSGEIVSDNEKKFRDNPFKDSCEKLCIRQCFASVKHPQANGLVERANRSLGEGIKARLDERSKDWIGELSHVLWTHRTMIKSSNGETPFSLTYGTEAVIPAEIGMPTLRTAEVDLTKNDEALEINLDLIEEKREQAAIQEAKSKAKMEKYYNSKVRNTSFRPGDMVYRSNDASHAKDGGKLGPKWEGPYKVTESLGKGAYKLGPKWEGPYELVSSTSEGAAGAALLVGLGFESTFSLGDFPISSKDRGIVSVS
ncbi:reverse transcriptase domain-containing protein [Tanacetum coccineum]|uniref:Reverse transcriptase domain-containing protein n=1 Tax=Tanacetum coccineum TaxID=301880 RepID=A0ABQ4WG45_9ASTR